MDSQASRASPEARMAGILRTEAQVPGAQRGEVVFPRSHSWDIAETGYARLLPQSSGSEAGSGTFPQPGAQWCPDMGLPPAGRFPVEVLAAADGYFRGDPPTPLSCLGNTPRLLPQGLAGRNWWQLLTREASPWMRLLDPPPLTPPPPQHPTGGLTAHLGLCALGP